MKEKIILIGGGGHAKVLIDLIRTNGQFEITGILDSGLKIGSLVLGISVLGSDNLLSELYSKGIKSACIAVGSIKNNDKRKLLFENGRGCGFDIPFLIHPKAIVSKEAIISKGTQIMASAIIQTSSLIGDNTIINTGAIIEHDCKVGNHVHICPGAIISGGCSINDGAFIGAGATIMQSLNIGRNAVVAAGAVVINNVPDGVEVKGVPAK